jgi:hypothetical protein
MCKVLYFVVFLRQVATGHFVDLTTLGIFFRNAEGKTSECQIAIFISAMFYTIFTKKVYISNVIIFKNEKVFSKMIFLKQVKKYS